MGRPLALLGEHRCWALWDCRVCQLGYKACLLVGRAYQPGFLRVCRVCRVYRVFLLACRVGRVCLPACRVCRVYRVFLPACRVCRVFLPACRVCWVYLPERGVHLSGCRVCLLGSRACRLGCIWHRHLGRSGQHLQAPVVLLRVLADWQLAPVVLCWVQGSVALAGLPMVASLGVLEALLRGFQACRVQAMCR